MQWSHVTLVCAVLGLLTHGGSGLGSSKLSEGCSSLGLKLYGQLARRSEGNLFFSPLSVYTALNMVLFGSRGSTRDKVSSLLKNPVLGQGHLLTLKSVLESYGDFFSVPVNVSMANAMYYNPQKASLKRFFKYGLHKLLAVEAQALQYPSPQNAINSWVSQQTGGAIQDVVSPGDVTPDTALLLLNAVFFKGPWRYIFRKAAVKNGYFITGSGANVSVPTMTRVGLYRVRLLGHGLQARVLQMPFRGGRFSLFFILPFEARGMAPLENGQLTPEILEDALSNMTQPSIYLVRLPRFELQHTTGSMKAVLEDLGLTDLFSGNPNLSGMTTSQHLRLNDIKHQAFIRVNENGATAAAAAPVSGAVNTDFPTGLKRFIVDHPFLLVLRDNFAQLPLFMGRVNDPTGTQL